MLIINQEYFEYLVNDIYTRLKVWQFSKYTNYITFYRRWWTRHITENTQSSGKANSFCSHQVINIL